MTTTTEANVYAKCIECGVELADRDAISAHGKETMAPTGERGIVARGHRVSILNPTPEERQASRVRGAINSALDDLYSELDEQVRRGDFTEAEVTEGMRWFDLADGWDEYVAESEDD